MNEYGRDRFYPKIKVGDYWERDYLYMPLSGVTFDLTNIQIYKVLQEDLSAPDKITKRTYGTEYLWWYMCLVNDIVDPLEELFCGQNILVPDQDNIYRFFNTYRVNQ